ncbi:MAG: anti-sigma factor family protein [Bacillota bacterium]
MNCKFDTDLIQEYLEGSIDPIEKIFLEEHLKVCKKCRAELTHLKLLFYEFESIKDIEMEVPTEVETVRAKVLSDLFDKDESGYGVKEFVKQQKEAINLAAGFLNFIPGKSIVKNGLKGANSLVGSASRKGIKHGLKLIQARV